MWLINSSVGRKVVMSITGLALILFLTFHMAMNLVAIISPEGYNWICEMLGANWYALIASAALAGLVAIHFIYAIWLTLQNLRARGNQRYAVTDKPKKVEWASQNMLVLGFVVVVGLLLHLFNFWFKMQFSEIMGIHTAIENGGIAPTDGARFIAYTFSNPVYVIVYILWLVGLWFHLTHGFWSALQTIGWNSKVWFNRWRVTSNIYTTILILGFAAVIVVYFVYALINGQIAFHW